MTHLRPLATLTLALLLSACGGDGDDSPDPILPPVTGDDDDTADTATGNNAPIAGEVRLLAFFGWDDVLGEVTKPEGYRSEFAIQISVEDWSGADDPSQYCTIRIGLEGLTADPEATNNGWLWGLSFPQGDSQAYEEDCTERGFDMETNELRSIEEWVEGPHYLAIGGAPSPDTLDWLTNVADVPAEEIDNYIGGEVTFPSAPDGNDDTYWYSLEVDDQGVPLDDGDYVDRFSVANNDNGLKFGYYNMRQTVYWYYY